MYMEIESPIARNRPFGENSVNVAEFVGDAIVKVSW